MMETATMVEIGAAAIVTVLVAKGLQMTTAVIEVERKTRKIANY